MKTTTSRKCYKGNRRARDPRLRRFPFRPCQQTRQDLTWRKSLSVGDEVAVAYHNRGRTGYLLWEVVEVDDRYVRPECSDFHSIASGLPRDCYLPPEDLPGGPDMTRIVKPTPAVRRQIQLAKLAGEMALKACCGDLVYWGVEDLEALICVLGGPEPLLGGHEDTERDGRRSLSVQEMPCVDGGKS